MRVRSPVWHLAWSDLRRKLCPLPSSCRDHFAAPSEENTIIPEDQPSGWKKALESFIYIHSPWEYCSYVPSFFLRLRFEPLLHSVTFSVGEMNMICVFFLRSNQAEREKGSFLLSLFFPFSLLFIMYLIGQLPSMSFQISDSAVIEIFSPSSCQDDQWSKRLIRVREEEEEERSRLQIRFSSANLWLIRKRRELSIKDTSH